MSVAVVRRLRHSQKHPVADRLRSTPPVRSELARRAAALFDLPDTDASADASNNQGTDTSISPSKAEPASAGGSGPALNLPTPTPTLPPPGHLHLLTGPSGGGKSTRLRTLISLANHQKYDVVDVARIRLKNVPCVDQFGHSSNVDADLAFAAQQLSRVGLAEAFVFLRLPDELSDGQRWRLRLAIAVAQIMRRHARAAGTRRDEGGKMKPGTSTSAFSSFRPHPSSFAPRTLLVADEFCAVLDRVCACVVARAFRRTIDRLHRVDVPLCAVVATSHTDLQAALLPDEVVWCEDG